MGEFTFLKPPISKEMDGMIDGMPLDTRVYLYSLELTYRDDRGLSSSKDAGWVTLTR